MGDPEGLLPDAGETAPAHRQRIDNASLFDKVPPDKPQLDVNLSSTQLGGKGANLSSKFLLPANDLHVTPVNLQTDLNFNAVQSNIGCTSQATYQSQAI
ncbi:hypothetical protein CVS40_3141 [Lucilia cuprina]|nr:hypothetical protein CVS40_3141 [Lucilia cuprina]